MKKKKRSVLVISIALVSIFGFQRFYAKQQLEQYVARQNIPASQQTLKVLRKDWSLGGYNLFLAHKDEPTLLYTYHFERIAGKNEVSLSVYETSAADIQAKLFGGNGLTEAEMQKIDYPPLKD